MNNCPATKYIANLALVFDIVTKNFGDSAVSIVIRRCSSEGYRFPKTNEYLTHPTLPIPLYPYLLPDDETVDVIMNIGIESEAHFDTQSATLRAIDNLIPGSPFQVIFPYTAVDSENFDESAFIRIPKAQITIRFLQNRPPQLSCRPVHLDDLLLRLIAGIMLKIGDVLRQPYLCQNEMLSTPKTLHPKNRPDESGKLDFSRATAAITSLQEHMLNGECYLANYSERHFYSAPPSYFSHQVFLNTWAKNLSRFALFFLSSDSKTSIMSFSPERFLLSNAGWIATEPIKGTLKCSPAIADSLDLAEQLWNSTKERQEQIMVVDLLRNDLNTISEPGSVHVYEPFFIRKISNLLQMQSFIFGKQTQNLRMSELLKKVLPAGSISGTPKRAACNLIGRYESTPRGYYSGIFLFGEASQNFDSTILIRSHFKTPNGVYFGTGAGITTLSDPKNEALEMIAKAASFQVFSELNGERET